VGVFRALPHGLNADQILGGCTSFTAESSSSVTLFLNMVSNHLANTRYCVIKRPTSFSELCAIFSQSSLVDLVSSQEQQVLCRRPIGCISTSPRRAGGRSAHICIIRFKLATRIKQSACSDLRTILFGTKYLLFRGRDTKK
jgi:hypothetical protein